MRKPQVVIKLRPTSYAGLVNLGNRVIAFMTGNGNYTTPAPALLTLQGAVTDVENAIAAWRPLGNRGSHVDLTDLQNKSLTLWQLLRAEADYVQTTAQIAAGSDYAEMRAIMATSGFSLRSDNSPQGLLEAVQNFHRFISRSLAPNQIKLKWKRPLNVTSAGNVKSYRVLKGTTNSISAAVEIANPTRTTFTDTNNTATSQTWYYWVIAVNGAGDGAPSEVVTAIIVPS